MTPEEEAAVAMYKQRIKYLTAPEKVCPNCGKRFRLQVGRAEKSQHRRTGVIYCSRLCARAYAERERRRRIREATS